MKSNAPWSVKGIERDARETAKEAAKREGMTVGEWLNQIIYTAGSDEETDGEIEGLKLRDLVTAIEHLNKRISEADAKSGDALGGLSRNIGGVVERVQRLERVKPAEGSTGDVVQRLEKLERAGGDRHRIEALKALEKAVAQVATQFNTAHKTSVERLDANERQLQTLAERIDKVGVGEGDTAGAAFLKTAVDELAERVAHAERIAAEASALKEDASGSIDPSFVERTGERLRILGDEIKRGGDQIRDLEATIAKLSAQIDAAERRSAEGVQKVTDTVLELREEFSGEPGKGVTRAEIDAAITAANQDAEEDIAALQNRIDTIMGNLGAKEDKADPSIDATSITDIDTNSDTGATSPLDDTGPQTVATGDAILDIPSQSDDFAPIPPDVHDATVETSDDDDTDPFAFADEIEAAIEEPSEPGADFSFDLDDDEASSDAKALLSEVQEVFGKRDEATIPHSPNETSQDDTDNDLSVTPDETSPSLDDDLDAILADLDDGSEDQPKPNDEHEIRRNTTKAMLFGAEAPSETSDAAAPVEQAEKEDFLQAARRRAKEAAEEAANAKPTRRKLTPKQRAILAARARQKRLTAEPAEQVEEEESTTESAEKPKSAFAPEQPSPPQADIANEATDDTDDDEVSSGPAEKIASAVNFLRSKLPIARNKDETDNETPSVSAEESAHEEKPKVDGNSAAFATLKSTAAARPVTLALGVAIFLAAAALFFLVKDLVTKSPSALPTRPAATTTAPPESTTTAPNSSEAIETAAAPEFIASGPIIDPRTLYLEAMAALGTAASTDETTAAITTLEEAAALGHPPAQLQLGELYKTGQGVDQDLGQARTWFRRSANGGNVLAMHRIGVMTARGDGGPADTAEAVGWFELAANRGLLDSQYNLGAIYHPSENAGSSSIQDAGKAYFWYSLAAMNGDEQATPLAAGVAGALSSVQRGDIDAQIAAWTAQPADDAANEMAPTN